MSSPIPFFYRLFFLYIDPALCLVGVAGCFFLQDLLLDGYTPAPVRPFPPETKMLLASLGGFFACLNLLQIVLLRVRPRDVTVWKLLQGGTLLIDLAILHGYSVVLADQGRTHWSAWRPNEWSNLVITAAVAVIRTAFCAGFGLNGQVREKLV